jgi:hypothetical protein
MFRITMEKYFRQQDNFFFVSCITWFDPEGHHQVIKWRNMKMVMEMYKSTILVYIICWFCRQHKCLQIQGIHKRMARFQKLLENLFLILRGHNMHSRQRELSKFLTRYQQFVFMLTEGPRDHFPRWRRRRRRLSVCSVLRCPYLWLQCSVSIVHGLKKTLFLCGYRGLFLRG